LFGLQLQSVFIETCVNVIMLRNCLVSSPHSLGKPR